MITLLGHQIISNDEIKCLCLAMYDIATGANIELSYEDENGEVLSAKKLAYCIDDAVFFISEKVKLMEKSMKKKGEITMNTRRYFNQYVITIESPDHNIVKAAFY